jgi:hypothetical protein
MKQPQAAAEAQAATQDALETEVFEDAPVADLTLVEVAHENAQNTPTTFSVTV